MKISLGYLDPFRNGSFTRPGFHIILSTMATEKCGGIA